HVTPPSRDIWGPGERVPCLVISPLAKKGIVDHVSRNTTSILTTIEQRFGLPALNSRDTVAPSFADVFASLDIARGGFVRDRRTPTTMSQVITITNRSSSAVAGPIQLVLDGISANTSLANATGTTANNGTASPYITVSATGLAPGASATVTLQ